MLPHSPNAGTANHPATPSRLDRRRQRRKVKTVVALDPAIKRAAKAAVRRQGFGSLNGIIERLLVLWLRSKRGQRSHMVSFGFYEPDKSHAGNAANMALSIAEFQELQPAKPQQAIRFGDYQIVRTDRDDGGCIIDLGTMQISPGLDCSFWTFWETVDEAERQRQRKPRRM